MWLLHRSRRYLVGRPSSGGTGHTTREKFAVALGMGRGEGGRSGSPFPGGLQGRKHADRAMSEGGGSAPVSSSSARRFYISRSGACLASLFFSSPQLNPSQWCSMPLLFSHRHLGLHHDHPEVRPRSGPHGGEEELRQFAVCHENFHMALICEAMRLHPRAGVYVIAAPTGPHFAAEQPSRFAQALARPMEPRQDMTPA